MYRLETSQTASEIQPRSSEMLAGFAGVIALSLVGVAGVVAIGYFLPATATKAYWFISRSSGVVAYVLITVGVLWGLVQSGGLFRRRITPVLSLGMHSYLSWIGLAFAGLHGMILIGDGYINIDLPRVFTPFLSAYRPIPVGLGIVAFYLMLLLTLSFYARSHLGQGNFRLLHYLSFLIFLMVTVHGLYAGTDSLPLWWLYGLSLVSVVVLTSIRILNTRSGRKAVVQSGRHNPTSEQPRGTKARV